MLRRISFALLAVVVLTPVLMAQVRGFGGTGHGSPGFVHGVTFAARNHSPGSRGFYLGDTPYFYADYPFQQFTVEPAPPQVFIVQPPAITPPETKSEPLLIELRGDRYVRFGGLQKSGDRPTTTLPDYADDASTKSPASGTHSKPHPQAELLPAVLIYRDGHREVVSDYAIVGAVLYARGDYWQNGYWTKDVPLSALNLPATMKANQDLGVKFVLPRSPNEVVTRP